MDGKPPLGVVPKSIWLEQRAQELTRALVEYTKAGEFTTLQQEWAEELSWVIGEINAFSK